MNNSHENRFPIENNEDIRQHWIDFKESMIKKAEYNKQNLNRNLNGAGKFVDFLCGIESQKNTSYVNATEENWPSK